MPLMPTAAMVPTTVEMRAEIRAMATLRASASRIMLLVNRLLYQFSVKPVNTERLLLSLKLNTAITTMGTYKKEKISTM